MKATAAMEKPWNAKRVFIFVFQEMVRFQKELEAGKHHDWAPRDALSFIADPKGGHRIIGRNAEVRLIELAERTISKDAKVSGRLLPNDLVRLFKLRLGKAIYEDEPTQAPQIVSECLSEAKISVLQNFTFYIPCLLPEHSHIKRFRIGPVLFWEKKRFISSQLSFHGGEAGYFEDFKQQKIIFNWMAEVTIEQFNEAIAKERAYLFVRLAIAGIKVAFDDR